MASTRLAAFGPGAIFLKRTDISNATPVNIGKAQAFSFDIAADSKELYGEDDFPLVTAISTRKLTGKMSAALISGSALNTAFYGGTLATGTTKIAIDEAGTIPSATTFTVTVANSADFVDDEGVRFGDTDVPLTLVASAPATGQYSVANGVYTFASADGGKKVKISYRYSDDTNGQSQTISARPIGTTPFFRVSYQIITNGVPFYVGFKRAISTKLSLAFKLTDFALPEIDFSAMQDDAGDVVEFGYGNVG